LATAAKTESAAEKKSLHAAERDTEGNQKRREEFVAKIRNIAPERLIFLDESGASSDHPGERIGMVHTLHRLSTEMKKTL
jgi:hypothetical protein